MWSALLERLASGGLVRRGVDAAFGCYAHRRAAALDRLSTASVQADTLLRLVRRAARTRFGREHDFASIRCVADYQARVPLRDYDAFWRDYWQPALPHLTDATWPGGDPLPGPVLGHDVRLDQVRPRVGGD